MKSQSDPLWATKALECVCEVASEQETFTGDDVMNILEERGLLPNEHRALGPVMIEAAKANIMEKTDRFQSSTRKTQHGSPRRVWRSLIWGTK